MSNLLRPLLVLVLFLGTTAGAIGEGVDGFPNWAERVEHEWMNRARCDPQVEMVRCGAACVEGDCNQPVAPLAGSRECWRSNLGDLFLHGPARPWRRSRQTIK